MALIKQGSFNDFRVKAKPTLIKTKSAYSSIKTFNEIGESANDTPEEGFDLIASSDARGIGIKSIELQEGFEGFLQGFLNPVNEIYFIAYAWDLSGQPIINYPGDGFKKEDVIFNMRVGSVRQFLGQGINLFPKRFVKGGIAIRIQIWESDQGARDFGNTIVKITNTIKDSSLNNILSLLTSLSGVSGTLINTIKDGALELSGLIGEILKDNSDDYVDYYEGYFDSSKVWEVGEDKCKGSSTILELEKF